MGIQFGLWNLTTHQQETAAGIVPRLTKLAECWAWVSCVFSQTLPMAGLPHNLRTQLLCEQIHKQWTHALRPGLATLLIRKFHRRTRVWHPESSNRVLCNLSAAITLCIPQTRKLRSGRPSDSDSWHFHLLVTCRHTSCSTVNHLKFSISREDNNYVRALRGLR